jgi:hypothetical protein
MPQMPRPRPKTRHPSSSKHKEFAHQTKQQPGSFTISLERRHTIIEMLLSRALRISLVALAAFFLPHAVMGFHIRPGTVLPGPVPTSASRSCPTTLGATSEAGRRKMYKRHDQGKMPILLVGKKKSKLNDPFWATSSPKAVPHDNAARLDLKDNTQMDIRKRIAGPHH